MQDSCIKKRSTRHRAQAIFDVGYFPPNTLPVK
jgi:hypothetical protein